MPKSVTLPSQSERLLAIVPDPAIESLVEIHWILTRRCQYACWYCPPHRHDPNAYQAENWRLLGGLERLERHLADRPSRINLTGGEPTLHPAFIAFVCQALQLSNLRAVRIVTNLASPPSTVEKLAKLAEEEGARIQVVASYHTERARSGTFVDRVRRLAASGALIHVKLLLAGDVANWRSDCRLADLVAVTELENVSFSVQRIRETTRFSEREFQVLPRMTAAERHRWGDSRCVMIEDGARSVTRALDEERLIGEGLNRFPGWSCDVGLRNMFIDSDGSVFSSLCRPEGDSSFNLFDPRGEWPLFGGVECPHRVCECASTVRIPKRAPLRS